MEQPSKRIKVVAADEDEAGGAAAEVDAAVASAASPTDNLEKLVRSLKSYPLMEKVLLLFPPLPRVSFAVWARPAGPRGKQTPPKSPRKTANTVSCLCCTLHEHCKNRRSPPAVSIRNVFVAARLEFCLVCSQQEKDSCPQRLR